MLTREHAIVDYDWDRVLPDRLSKRKHGDYLFLAQRMCDIYRHGVGRTRKALHLEIRSLFAAQPDCPPQRIEAFCKLLDDVSQFERDEDGKAAKLRMQVFRAAAQFHPLVADADPWFEHSEKGAKEIIAQDLGRSWSDIDQHLFDDLLDFHRLQSFEAFNDPSELLSRYNVGQVQVALFDAIQMTVYATEDLKEILRYAKLARLIHRIRKEPSGYRFDFDGPASLFSQTHRYGVAMARFLPGLLSCKGWRMQALLKPNRWYRKVILTLDEHSGLSSSVPLPTEFDSKLEEHFFHRWGNEPREGWRLERESIILSRDQRVFVPDFRFVHEDGRSVLFEIIGFWTPEYLQHKVDVLEFFKDYSFLFAVSKSLRETISLPSSRMLEYKTSISVDHVLSLLNQSP